jgi:NAD(P)H dehydrogenase (quinone)
MILVTGAAGKTGRAVIRALTLKGGEVKALVHRPDQIRPVQELGARTVLSGDMRDQSMMDDAVRNVRAVYYIPPNVNPDELLMGQVALRACSAAGVDHFVYHSVLRPQIKAMPHHWLKMHVEEQVFGSGLDFTILQPAVYLQNLLAHKERIMAGEYLVPYAPETRLSYVDLDDVATVAAQVIGARSHMSASYELVGIEGVTQIELAAALAERLDRPVRPVHLPPAQWESQARAAGLAPYQIETLLEMFRYYEKVGFSGNPNILTWLLGRRPTDLRTFLQRTAWARRTSSRRSRPVTGSSAG